MAKILVDYDPKLPDKAKQLLTNLGESLTQRGHSILQFEGDEHGLVMDSILAKYRNQADCFLFYYPFEVDRDYFEKVYLRYKAYTSSSNKLLILLTDGMDTFSVNSLVAPFAVGEMTERRLELLANNVDNAINEHLGRRDALSETRLDLSKKIRSNADEYISTTKRSLANNARLNKWIAFGFYIAGLTSLILASIFAYNLTEDFFKSGSKEWSIIIFYCFKSLVMISLLLAATKYSLDLGHSYMEESIRISERLHAISFGDFYLKIVDSAIDPAELKEIFRDWNINTQVSSFSKRHSDYDPKFLERIQELFEKAIKSKDKIEPS